MQVSASRREDFEGLLSLRPQKEFFERGDLFEALLE
jgi:hypothetical protein